MRSVHVAYKFYVFGGTPSIRFQIMTAALHTRRVRPQTCPCYAGCSTHTGRSACPEKPTAGGLRNTNKAADVGRGGCALQHRKQPSHHIDTSQAVSVPALCGRVHALPNETARQSRPARVPTDHSSETTDVPISVRRLGVGEQSGVTTKVMCGCVYDSCRLPVAFVGVWIE
jgi:hypothetical protein